jgi:hypothetical protein
VDLDATEPYHQERLRICVIRRPARQGQDFSLSEPMKLILRLSSVCVLLLAACGEPREQPAVATRDSAGVRIVDVRFREPRAEDAWRVSDAPLAEAAGGPGSIYQVVSAFRLGDGRMVVASAGTGELRIYGADGRYLQTIGRKGDGPGEFRRLFWAGRMPGDSIAAWDAALARLSVFDPSGRLARSMTPRAPLGLFPQLHAVLRDGSAVIAAGLDPARAMVSAAGVRRDTVTLLVIGPDGAVRDTLGRFPGSEQYLMVPPGGGFVMHPLPFGRTLATGAQGAQFAVGSGDAYEVAVYESGGGVRRLIRADRGRRAVTDDDVRRYRETTVAMGAGGDARRQQLQLLREVPFPERMPALTALLPGGRGNWWIQEPPAAETGETAWSLVGGDGRLLGTLRTPAGLTVREIGTDWVLGIVLDDADVEHVRLYALER